MANSFMQYSCPILSFDLSDNVIYAIGGNNLLKIDLGTGRLISEKSFFPKTGLTRGVICDGRSLYVRNFCDFFIIDRQTLEPQFQCKLGEDLSSDICGFDYDKNIIYAEIRNGSLAMIDRNTREVETKKITGNTFRMKFAGDRFYCSSVGDLYIFDKSSWQPIRHVEGKNMIEGFILGNDRLIVAGKDRLVMRDIETLDSIQEVRKPHTFSFHIIGFWREYFLTAAFRDGVLRFWDSETMKPVRDIPIKACLTGEVKIVDDAVYLASRAVNGLERIDLADLAL